MLFNCLRVNYLKAWGGRTPYDSAKRERSFCLPNLAPVSSESRQQRATTSLASWICPVQQVERCPFTEMKTRGRQKEQESGKEGEEQVRGREGGRARKWERAGQKRITSYLLPRRKDEPWSDYRIATLTVTWLINLLLQMNSRSKSH